MKDCFCAINCMNQKYERYVWKIYIHTYPHTTYTFNAINYANNAALRSYSLNSQYLVAKTNHFP